MFKKYGLFYLKKTCFFKPCFQYSITSKKISSQSSLRIKRINKLTEKLCSSFSCNYFIAINYFDRIETIGNIRSFCIILLGHVGTNCCICTAVCHRTDCRTCLRK